MRKDLKDLTDGGYFSNSQGIHLRHIQLKVKCGTRASQVGSVIKNPHANSGNMSSIPGSGSSPGAGNGSPLQYSYLGNKRTEEPGG